MRKRRKNKVDSLLLDDIRKKYSPRLEKRHFEIAEKIENDENWILQRSTPRVKLYRMSWALEGVHIFKTIFHFKNVKVRQLYDHFYCQGGEYKGGEYIRVREPYLVYFRYVHIFDPENCITEQHCGYGIIFVQNREYVLFQTQRFQNGLITLAGESLDPEDADRVCGKRRLKRGRMFFGHIFRQKGKDVESVVFTYTNPGLPVFLYNRGAQQSAHDTALNFIKQFDKNFVYPSKTMSIEEKIEEVEDEKIKEKLIKLSSLGEKEREEKLQKMEDEYEEEMMRMMERKIMNLENRHLYKDELTQIRSVTKQEFEVIRDDDDYDQDHSAKSSKSFHSICLKVSDKSKARTPMKKIGIEGQGSIKECCSIL